MRLLPILLLVVAVVGCSNPQPQPAQAEYTAEQFTPSQVRQDLDTLFTYLDGLHPNLYHKAPNAQWLATKDSIRAGLSSNLNRAEFYMRLLPLFQLEQDGQHVCQLSHVLQRHAGQTGPRVLSVQGQVQRPAHLPAGGSFRAKGSCFCRVAQHQWPCGLRDRARL